MSTTSLHEYVVMTETYDDMRPLKENRVVANWMDLNDRSIEFWIIDNDLPSGKRMVAAFSNWTIVEDLTVKPKG